jgi:hypothetical protein
MMRHLGGSFETCGSRYPQVLGSKPRGRTKKNQQSSHSSGCNMHWALRHNLSATTTYVALAEMTGATALLTTDTRLANAPGINCPIELL